MDLSSLSRSQIEAGLRAMKVVAHANVEFNADERELLQAAADAFEVQIDPDALAPITPEEVAREITDPLVRQCVMQALIVMALADTEASREEIAVLEQFARVLGVDEPRLRNLCQLVDGNLTMLKIDMMRRYPLMRQGFAITWKDEGVRGIWKAVKWFAGRESNPELALRYKRLGLLPEGTFGRAIWKHMTTEGYNFPGEVGGLPEPAVYHDLLHVLTGYGTDAIGEIEVQAFHAGSKKEDPFAYIFAALIIMHVGIKALPIAAPQKGAFDSARVMRALRRGSQINFDPTDRWDHWPDVELTIDEVRRKYNVLPE